MLKKLLYTFVLLIPSTLYANEPKDWQLGFQKPASQSMYEIVKFHELYVGANNCCDKWICTIFDGLHMYKV